MHGLSVSVCSQSLLSFRTLQVFNALLIMSGERPRSGESQIEVDKATGSHCDLSTGNLDHRYSRFEIFLDRMESRYRRNVFC
jgi:hypothetical protein